MEIKVTVSARDDMVAMMAMDSCPGSWEQINTIVHFSV